MTTLTARIGTPIALSVGPLPGRATAGGATAGDATAGAATAGDAAAGSLPKLRRLPIPLGEPHAASRVGRQDVRRAVAHTQGTLALALTATAKEEDPEPAVERHLSAVPDQELPDPVEWAATFLITALEVTAGMRSPAQLVRWTTPTLQLALARRGALAQRVQRLSFVPHVPPVIRSLRFCSPRDQVYEVAAVVAERDKVRAVAFRMEGFDGRWRVTAFETC